DYLSIPNMTGIPEIGISDFMLLQACLVLVRYANLFQLSVQLMGVTPNPKIKRVKRAKAG
ncbi:MAG TPA: hypothetical protein VN328_05995, partial [Thermodesulfovibrionales bacterium]|nr:hypothetical protein [Thermodesulfovibrionales bacterium]